MNLVATPFTVSFPDLCDQVAAVVSAEDGVEAGGALVAESSGDRVRMGFSGRDQPGDVLDDVGGVLGEFRGHPGHWWSLVALVVDPGADDDSC